MNQNAVLIDSNDTKAKMLSAEHQNIGINLRQKKNRIAAALIAVLVIGGCILGVNYWWKHMAVHTDYYGSYIWEKNIARGICPIDKNSVSDYASYYRFQSVDGKVQSVEHLNYAGTLLPLREESTVLNLDASKIVFVYKGENVHSTQYYDCNGIPLAHYRYSADGTHVTLVRGATSGIAKYVAEDIVTAGVFSERIQITRYLQEFDESGRVVKRSYAYGEDYTLTSDGDGFFGYHLSYDENGNLEKVTYFKNMDGSLDENTSSIAYTYTDDTLRMESMTYLDADGRPVNGEQGWAKKECAWNVFNARESVAYFDSNLEPVFSPYGYASLKYEYDGVALASESYYDCDGEPVASINGYASVTFKVNELGEIISYRYWDVDGEATVDIADGVYGYEIDKRSEREHCLMYVNQDGEPMMTRDGFAYMYVTKDEFHYPLRQEYRDVSNELCTEHYASCTYQYDSVYHNVLEWRFFDENGASVIAEKVGCAAVVEEYDEEGCATLQKYLDADGELYDGDRGYAKVVRNCEAEGIYTVETCMYYDSDDLPVKMETLGAAGYEYTFYENGKMAGVCYLDEDKNAYFNEKTGYAGMNIVYDENGYLNMAQYFGESKEPVMVDGYASVFEKRDANGNILGRIFYNADGEKTVNPNAGYASQGITYDENGEIIEIYYLDENGEFMNHLQKGYAAVTMMYDEDGEMIDGGFWKVEDGALVPEE